ncbi:hypothetical protein PFJ87_11g02250 [Encephalitozoon hellem]|uniref:Uncharacterized protein n=1 Tax=Encephalitozoon hellem TaxID=27973 RepID=A0ABY8CPF8_ENCHE|nr:hypothetical protein PFJ87_10g00150 [Encephalitozoon hellem]WEL39986.1 hypothetical protein PFJ87_11g02250 [Encephalitozoon hellem]
MNRADRGSVLECSTVFSSKRKAKDGEGYDVGSECPHGFSLELESESSEATDVGILLFFMTVLVTLFKNPLADLFGGFAIEAVGVVNLGYLVHSTFLKLCARAVDLREDSWKSSLMVVHLSLHLVAIGAIGVSIFSSRGGSRMLMNNLCRNPLGIFVALIHILHGQDAMELKYSNYVCGSILSAAWTVVFVASYNYEHDMSDSLVRHIFLFMFLHVVLYSMENEIVKSLRISKKKLRKIQGFARIIPCIVCSVAGYYMLGRILTKRLSYMEMGNSDLSFSFLF